MNEIEVNGELGVFVPYIYVFLFFLGVGVILGLCGYLIDYSWDVEERIKPVLEENQRLRENYQMQLDHMNPNAWVIDITPNE